MLCDLMLSQWADPAKNPTFEPEVEKLIKLVREAEAGYEDEARRTPVTPERLIEVRSAILKYEASGLHLSPKGGIDFGELPAFQAMLRNSQKFTVSPEFASVSLQRFSTPETLAKAKDWFHLIHDPMWLEWNYEERPGCRLGALFYTQTTVAGDKSYWCYLTAGLIQGRDGSKVNTFLIYHYRLLPETARSEGGVFSMDIEADGGMEVDENDFPRILACSAYDFIIRINSPRITEFRPCDDLSKINKKRMRLGRAPLCSYQIVDCNRSRPCWQD